MDITTITSYRRAREREDLSLAPGETFIAGGTWLLSEPQPATTGFVDLTTMRWPALEVTSRGLRIGATCTIAELVAWAGGRATLGLPDDWAAASLATDAANALLASFKVWNTATVGGNVCRSFAAGAMIALLATLDGVAEVWRADGSAYTTPVAELITGNGENRLSRGDVLRAVAVPAAALRSRAVLRKIALAEHGRSGAVVSGRRDLDGACVVVVTAATSRPAVFRFPAVPDAATLAAAVESASGYYSDPLGSADWRRGVSVVLAERVRRELDGQGGEA